MSDKKSLRKYISSIIKEEYSKLNDNEITPPNIPNTMNFWHGGNLENYDDIIAQKNGRYG